MVYHSGQSSTPGLLGQDERQATLSAHQKNRSSQILPAEMPPKEKTFAPMTALFPWHLPHLPMTASHRHLDKRRRLSPVLKREIRKRKPKLQSALAQTVTSKVCSPSRAVILAALAGLLTKLA